MENIYKIICEKVDWERVEMSIEIFRFKSKIKEM